MTLRTDPAEPDLRTTEPQTTEPQMTEHQTTEQARGSCDETRATRLHYQLRCLLPVGHDGRHAWTPELLPVDGVRATA